MNNTHAKLPLGKVYPTVPSSTRSPPGMEAELIVKRLLFENLSRTPKVKQLQCSVQSALP